MVEQGSRNFRLEPAMTPQEVKQAIQVGARMALDAKTKRNCDAATVGEAGIGNTSSASAILSLLLGWPEDETVNFNGKDREGLLTGLHGKRRVVRQAVQRARGELVDAGCGKYNNSDYDPWSVLKQVDGLEIAAMCGFMIEGSNVGLAVIVDGYIATVAALLATRMEPGYKGALFFSHSSEDEPCGPRVLAEMEVQAPVAARLRLGEGTGAIAAWPLLQAAASLPTILTGPGAMAALEKHDPYFVQALKTASGGAAATEEAKCKL